MNSVGRSATSWFESKLDINGASMFLCAALFVNRLGAMTKMFFPIYLVSVVGYSVQQASALMSAYGLGLLSGAFALGYIADLAPPKMVATTAFCASALFLSLLGLTTNELHLLLILGCAGFFDSGANVLGQRLLLETTPDNERPQVQALIRVGNNLGAAFAGVLCGMLALLDYRAVFAFDAICSLGAAYVVWSKVSSTHRASSKCASSTGRRQGAHPFFDVPFLTFEAGVLLVAMAYHALYFGLGNYVVENYGGGPSDLGIQFTINAALIVVLQIPVTKKLARFDPPLLVGAGCLLLCTGFLLLYSGSSKLALAASTLIWTLGEITLFPLINMEIMKRAEGRRSGQYFGLAAAIWNSAALTTPLCIGAIAAWSSLKHLWIACGAACVVAAALMFTGLYLFKRHA